MRKILEDLYHGNISPCEKEMTPGSELQRAISTAAKRESQLSEELGEAQQVLLNKLIDAQHEIGRITAEENFIMGFKLGIRLMAECMEENDGDIRDIGE